MTKKHENGNILNKLKDKKTKEESAFPLLCFFDDSCHDQHQRLSLAL